MVLLEQEPLCSYVVHTLQRCPHNCYEALLYINIPVVSVQTLLWLRLEKEDNTLLVSGQVKTFQQLNEHPSS